MAAGISNAAMERVALIGFGEAARAFTGAPGWRGSTVTFDLKLLAAATRSDVERAAAAARVAPAASTEAAVMNAPLVISVVTADQAVHAAASAAPALRPGALYCDFNSAAPGTKQAAAALIEGAGGRYVDVAVMAPVHPAGLDVPLLIAGRHADAARAMLHACGFGLVERLDGAVGTASSVKMIRSVMIKGMEALTAECLLAADAAGVRDAVLASLDASERPRPWAERADYDLDRMMVHGLRRAAEMAEVVRTLDTLGTGSAMARATADRQHAIGALGLSPPAGLDAKLALLRPLAAQRDAA